jgi:hypothetical protein
VRDFRLDVGNHGYEGDGLDGSGAIFSNNLFLGGRKLSTVPLLLTAAGFYHH